MNLPAKGSCLVGLGIFIALVGRPARATDGPLLVVVEAPPALDADAAEIRRAIGAELRSETIAPMRTPTDAPERALIVALDRDRIAMSLRAGDATPVARSIPAPPEHAARLRAIAWLAGNLARDQVSPILAEGPVEAAPLATIPAITPPITEVVPSSPGTEPPPLQETTPTIAAHVQSNPSGPARWSIGAADGPTVGLYQELWGASNFPQFRSAFQDTGTIWRVEVQRRSSGDGLLSGIALEGMAGGFAPEVLGLTTFVGTEKHYGRWSFEADIGVGIEAIRSGYAIQTVMMSNGAQTETTAPTSTRPGLYGSGALAVAHPIYGSMDVVLRLGAHISTVDTQDWFISTTLGLRYNL